MVDITKIAAIYADAERYGGMTVTVGGWAKTILHNDRMVEMFRTFFNREDTFGLGICNGCPGLPVVSHYLSAAASAVIEIGVLAELLLRLLFSSLVNAVFSLCTRLFYLLYRE